MPASCMLWRRAHQASPHRARRARGRGRRRSRARARARDAPRRGRQPRGGRGDGGVRPHVQPGGDGRAARVQDGVCVGPRRLGQPAVALGQARQHGGPPRHHCQLGPQAQGAPPPPPPPPPSPACPICPPPRQRPSAPIRIPAADDAAGMSATDLAPRRRGRSPRVARRSPSAGRAPARTAAPSRSRRRPGLVGGGGGGEGESFRRGR